MEKETKEGINFKCKKCNSTMVYLRIKTNQRVCKNCGFIEELK